MPKKESTVNIIGSQMRKFIDQKLFGTMKLESAVRGAQALGSRFFEEM